MNDDPLPLPEELEKKSTIVDDIMIMTDSIEKDIKEEEEKKYLSVPPQSKRQKIESSI